MKIKAKRHAKQQENNDKYTYYRIRAYNVRAPN